MSPRRTTLWLPVCLLFAMRAQVPEASIQKSTISSRARVSTVAVDAWSRGELLAQVTRQAAPAPPPEELAPYIADRYLAAPPAGHTLQWVADQIGGELLVAEGSSGYGVLRADDIAEIEATGAIVSPLGRIVGAGAKKTTAAKTTTTTTTTTLPSLPPPSWHLDAMGVPRDNADWSGWVVAVLDSGVAYETQGRFAQAPGLAAVQWIEPLDLVEMDDHPNDDHQHGTHIASLIASEGSYPGVVPGVSLMPVKVLDSRNQGTEWSLVEGIHSALDAGVDVINLSLSFPLGYVPSNALLDALSRAWEQGVVVVAASGNAGARELTWPAASRFAISVGASGTRTGFLAQTSYSNVSPKLDVLAPGGEIGVDQNGDGWIDGILAETIDPADPGRVGLWFYQGTSQSAALVSGLAVRLLAAGVDPHDIAPTLQRAGGGYEAWDAMLTGTGADVASLPDALSEPSLRGDVYVGLLPHLAASSQGSAVPRARVSVVDARGQPIAGATVLGTIYKPGGIGYPMCQTNAMGSCDLSDVSLGGGNAWAFRVEAVVRGGVADRPSRALWTSEGALVLLDALSATEGWDAVAVYWPGGPDPLLGNTLEAWAVIDSGAGLLSSPLGVLVRPTASGLVASESLLVDVDGTGLLSSPLGTQLSLKTATISLSGSGLLSSPLGTSCSLRLVGIDGSGLLSSPLGFHATQLYTSGSGLLSSPLGTSALLLDRKTMTGSSTEDALLFESLLASPFDAASLVVASGSIDVGLAAAPGVSGASGAVSAVPYAP